MIYWTTPDAALARLESEKPASEKFAQWRRFDEWRRKVEVEHAQH